MGSEQTEETRTPGGRQSAQGRARPHRAPPGRVRLRPGEPDAGQVIGVERKEQHPHAGSCRNRQPPRQRTTQPGYVLACRSRRQVADAEGEETERNAEEAPVRAREAGQQPPGHRWRSLTAPEVEPRPQRPEEIQRLGVRGAVEERERIRREQQERGQPARLPEHRPGDAREVPRGPQEGGERNRSGRTRSGVRSDDRAARRSGTLRSPPRRHASAAGRLERTPGSVADRSCGATRSRRRRCRRTTARPIAPASTRDRIAGPRASLAAGERPIVTVASRPTTTTVGRVSQNATARRASAGRAAAHRRHRSQRLQDRRAWQRRVPNRSDRQRGERRVPPADGDHDRAVHDVAKAADEGENDRRRGCRHRGGIGGREPGARTPARSSLPARTAAPAAPASALRRPSSSQESRRGGPATRRSRRDRARS